MNNPFIRVKTEYILNDKEKQILQLLANGKISKEIGSEVNLSYRTVEAYIGKMKSATGCTTIAHLVAEALRHNIIN